LSASRSNLIAAFYAALPICLQTVCVLSVAGHFRLLRETEAAITSLALCPTILLLPPLRLLNVFISSARVKSEPLITSKAVSGGFVSQLFPRYFITLVPVFSALASE
jgi:hypothetical protein